MGAHWQLPGYELDEMVGFGGSGEVWRARELISGDVVALKRMRSGDDFARDRLRREAAVLSSVAGTHVVRIRDVVLTEAEAVLVMDYAPGGNLDAVLGVRGRLAAPEVVTLVGPLATALADAHARGIVHGDVTPANIVFSGDGRPLLTDFGVARVLGAHDREPAEPGAVEATPPYAAPEVLAGEPAAAASDVYSLCKVADAALDRSTAPSALCAAIDTGLAAEPHARPRARDLAVSVLRSGAAAPVRLVRTAAVAPAAITQRVDAARPTADEPPPPVRQRRAWRVPRRLVVTAVVAATLVLAVAGGVVWGHRTVSSAAVLAPRSAAVVVPPTDPPTLAADDPADDPPTHAPATAATHPVVLPVWPDVVARYDALRAQAFESGDTSLLRSIYADGAAALTADLTTLRAFTARGWQVRGFAITTRRVAPDVVTPDAATVTVTDAMSAYSVVDGTGRVVQVVPARAARTFAMQLVRVGASWRIAQISR